MFLNEKGPVALMKYLHALTMRIQRSFYFQNHDRQRADIALAIVAMAARIVEWAIKDKERVGEVMKGVLEAGLEEIWMRHLKSLSWILEAIWTRGLG